MKRISEVMEVKSQEGDTKIIFFFLLKATKKKKPNLLEFS